MFPFCTVKTTLMCNSLNSSTTMIKRKVNRTPRKLPPAPRPSDLQWLFCPVHQTGKEFLERGWLFLLQRMNSDDDLLMAFIFASIKINKSYRLWILLLSMCQKDPKLHLKPMASSTYIKPQLRGFPAEK